jgi:hypothetical protein
MVRVHSTILAENVHLPSLDSRFAFGFYIDAASAVVGVASARNTNDSEGPIGVLGKALLCVALRKALDYQ